MLRASYCNVYISRTARCTNSYNLSLFIIKCSVWLLCGYSHTTATRMVPAYTNCYIQLQNVAPDHALKSPKHVEHLMINKDTL